MFWTSNGVHFFALYAGFLRIPRESNLAKSDAKYDRISCVTIRKKRSP